MKTVIQTVSCLDGTLLDGSLFTLLILFHFCVLHFDILCKKVHQTAIYSTSSDHPSFSDLRLRVKHVIHLRFDLYN